jgi:DNA-binding MarR family transcriptional regulator
MNPTDAQADVVPLDRTVGHLIRRAEQVNTAMWRAEFSREFTGPQFGLMVGILHNEPLDQSDVRRLISLDRSTAADVISRLVRNGLVVRARSTIDARRNTLTLTDDARAMLSEMTKRVLDMQERFMDPIPAGEREWFVEHLVLVAFAGPAPTEAEAFVPSRLATLPGHLIRRAEQIHDSHWTDLIGTRITPSQYALMAGIASEGIVDQRRAAALASLDTSSTSNIAGRLAGRDLISKEPDPQDKRRTLLSLTPDGWELMSNIGPAARAVQEVLLEPLRVSDSARFMGLLSTVAYRGRPVDSKIIAA